MGTDFVDGLTPLLTGFIIQRHMPIDDWLLGRENLKCVDLLMVLFILL